MAERTLALAMIHEVFPGPEYAQRLDAALGAARRGGAQLAVLPELPLQRWAPATRSPREEDAEPERGPIHAALSRAAASAGLGVLGGAIVRDGAGTRRNRALLFDASGELVASYDKLHLPREDGFWESDHYEPGVEGPRPADAFGMPLGLQICSDVQRFQGCQLLAYRGAEAILVPRATPPASYPRWLLVLRAVAVTCAAWVVSVNRPGPESGVDIGGPSVTIDPFGNVAAESTDALSLVRLDSQAVAAARRDYPGYLDFRAALYARLWNVAGAEPHV